MVQIRKWMLNLSGFGRNVREKRSPQPFNDRCVYSQLSLELLQATFSHQWCQRDHANHVTYYMISIILLSSLHEVCTCYGIKVNCMSATI